MTEEYENIKTIIIEKIWNEGWNVELYRAWEPRDAPAGVLSSLFPSVGEFKVRDINISGHIGEVFTKHDKVHMVFEGSACCEIKHPASGALKTMVCHNPCHRRRK